MMEDTVPAIEERWTKRVAGLPKEVADAKIAKWLKRAARVAAMSAEDKVAHLRIRRRRRRRAARAAASV
jgi:hypothetical protein